MTWKVYIVYPLQKIKTSNHRPMVCEEQLLRQKLPELKFFNNLTTTNRHLLWLAKGTAKENNYMFAWASPGTLLVKKQLNGRIIKICCEDDLNKIV